MHRSFECLDEEMFLPLYKALIRPTLEYGSCVWSPHLKKHIKLIEDVQRRATKLVPLVAHLPYDQRLRKLGLVTLEYRRDRADMIQIFKSLHKLDDLKWEKLFDLAEDNLRGHHLKLRGKNSKSNVRLNTFSQRTIHYWNSLEESTIAATSVNQFKSLLNSEKWNIKKFNPSVN